MEWGVGVCLFCAAVWVSIEAILCPMPNKHYEVGKVLGYAPGHAVWHVGMSYGLSLICIWFITMNSVLERRKYFAYKTLDERVIKCPKQCPGAGGCNKCLDRVFPIITNNRWPRKKDSADDDDQCELKVNEDGRATIASSDKSSKVVKGDEESQNAALLKRA